MRNKSRQPQMALLMAALSAIAFDSSRSIESPSPWLAAALAMIPALGIVVLGRWIGARNSRATAPTWQTNLFVVAAMFSNLPIEIIARQLLSFGQPGEIVMLESLRNLLLSLAAVGVWRSYEQLTAVLSLFVVVFVASVSEHAATFFLLAVYSALGVWWLMGSYWDQVRHGLCAAEQRRLPRAVGVSLCSLFIAVCAALAMFRSESSSIAALTGFMPTSGGTGQFDPFARSGVNDGDAMVAAKKDAQSVGPVNSEIFLTSDQPSLYDALSDLYGEAVKPKEQSRAVALGSDLSRPEKQHATSTKDGKQFSTLRSRRRTVENTPKDLQTPAMFFVAGRTPLHLRLETFDHFDGHDWTHQLPTRSERIPIAEERGEQSWFRFAMPLTNFELGETRFHHLKIANLATNRIPLSPGANAVRIDRVELPDFFGDTADDAICLRGSECIPSLTILQLRSERVSDAARNSGDFQNTIRIGTDYLAIDPAVQTKLTALAQTWTKEVPRGWPTINAIVQQLRTHYTLDPDATLPADVEHAALHFLTESKRGPDYLFATSAVMLLRSLGYPARFCVGFYAKPENYDRVSRSTPVFKQDVHVWAEVCFAGRHWMPIEPTPGYETLDLERSLWQQACNLIVDALRWIGRHLIGTSCFFALLLTAWVRRHSCWDKWLYLQWWCSRWRSTEQHLLATVQYWERRAKLAGIERPRWQSIDRWCAELLPKVVDARDDQQALITVIQAARILRYATGRSLDSVAALSANEWRRTCAKTVRVWTVSRLKSESQSTKPRLTATNSFATIETKHRRPFFVRAMIAEPPKA